MQIGDLASLHIYLCTYLYLQKKIFVLVDGHNLGFMCFNWSG